MFVFSIVPTAQKQQPAAEYDSVIAAAKRVALSTTSTFAEALTACEYLDCVDCELFANDQVLYAACLNFAHAYILAASDSDAIKLSERSLAATTLYKIVDEARALDLELSFGAEEGEKSAVAYG